MAVIGKKDLFLQEEQTYFQKFLARNGEEYGLRFGSPKDANAISMMFKEIYGYKYINPLVYDVDYIKQDLVKPNNFWLVGELIDTKEIAGVGLIEKKRYIAHSSKGMTRKKFQGKGVTTKIGAAGLISITKMPQFKEVLKIDTEVRGPEVRAQKLNQNAGAINYGLIPAYINFGDKRHFKANDNTPYPPKQEEAAFMYSIIFKNLWRIRDKEVYLIDDDDLLFFYNHVKSQCKKMNYDNLVIKKGKKNKGYELYGVSKDYYNGLVNLYGNIQEKSLVNLLKTYRKWRIILWKVPVTQNGIHSMALALEKGFNVVGYDVGFNNMNWKLFDSVIFAYYPIGARSQVFDVNYLEENKPLFNKVREIFFSRIN
ncbi:MAG: hypothetical protein ACFFA3_12935 [Promethearchaeota archaeon]